MRLISLRATWIAALGTLSVLMFSGEAAAAVPASLAGESFNGQYSPGFISGQCNPAGNSTLSFTATGTATGPYPGTFSETMTVTVGPQTVGTTGLGFGTGQLVNAHAEFTIDSANGHVSGSKDLDFPSNVSAPMGTCDSTGSDNPTLSQICENLRGQPGSSGASERSASGHLTYAADIAGGYRD